jgi:hypothetical protein
MMTGQEEQLKMIRQELRNRLNTFSPTDLNPELVRLKLVDRLLDDNTRALSEITDKERKAIAQLRAIAQAYKYKDAAGGIHGGLPLSETFCSEYLALGAALDRKREDAVIACLRPRSGYNYKFGPDDGQDEKPGMLQRLKEFITGKKEEKK